MEFRYDLFVGDNARKFLEALPETCDFEHKTCPQYLLFVRNNIHSTLMKSADRQKDLNAFQDHFLEAIARFHMGDANFDAHYHARNRMLLGRLNEARAFLEGIEDKVEQTYYFLSLIHFLHRDVQAFNDLGKHCAENTYYRYLYWRLNNRYFSPDDPDVFEDFWSKSYGFDLQEQNSLFQLQLSD